MPLKSARLGSNLRLVKASDNRPEIGRLEADKKAVEILQTCFVELGFSMPQSTKPSGLLDGVFGQETEAVVKAFQQANGLKPDGIVGRNTLAALDATFFALEASEGASIAISMLSPHGWEIT